MFIRAIHGSRIAHRRLQIFTAMAGRLHAIAGAPLIRHAVLLAVLFASAAISTAAPPSAYFELAGARGIVGRVPLRIEDVRPQPVLTRGTEGTWDAVDVLNPSVVRFKGRLFNYYSGYDGRIWRTGVAVSDDGITWTKHPNSVLEPSDRDWDVSYISANGAAVVHRGEVLYFYQGVDRQGGGHIGLARSSDGVTFKKVKVPVMSPGPRHTWDSKGVADPYVFAKGGSLYLYYLGQDEAGLQRLGVAESTNGGANWTKFIANPILDSGAANTFDENGAGEPSIAYVPPYFYMMYTGRDAAENRNLGYAVSTDGTHWKKMSTSGLLSAADRGGWASHVVCDSTFLEARDGKYFVWFGGGNRPEPAENLNGEIGLMTVDLSQNRDMAAFDPNSDWNATPVASTDILRGSYGIEGEPGQRWAWAGPSCAATFVVGENQKDKSLVLRGWIPADAIRQFSGGRKPVTVTMKIGTQRVERQSFTTNSSFAMVVPWSKIYRLADNDGLLEIDIRTSGSFIPAKHGNNPDVRDLAVKISSLRFE